MASRASSALVVDASVAVKWHLTDEPDAELALSVLAHFVRGDLHLVAPDQIRYEVPSAITVATLGPKPRISVEHARLAIEKFLAIGIQTFRGDELILAAFSLVHRYGIAFYDALYLALAQSLSVPFLTADAKLHRQIRELPGVVWIGDFGASAA